MRKSNSFSDIQDYVKKHHLEQAFPEDTYHFLEVHYFKKGEYLCRAGESIRYFHLIVDGTCKVIPLSEDGKVVLLTYLPPLGMSGDIELLCDCEALHSVCAATDVAALACPKKAFQEKLMKHISFLQYISRWFANKSLDSSQRHSSKMLYPIKNRFSRYLLTEAENYDSNTFPFKTTEISQSLGITARHLRRVVRNFEDEGIVAREHGMITILDEDTLEDYATC